MEPGSGLGFFESLWTKLMGEPTQAEQEANNTTPVFVWSNARFKRRRTDRGLELTMEMPEVDLSCSRAEVADQSLILELQYRNTTPGKLCMNDRYRRTVPLDVDVPEGNSGLEISWRDGELCIVLEVLPTATVSKSVVQHATHVARPAARRL